MTVPTYHVDVDVLRAVDGTEIAMAKIDMG